jgi:hypothetical protein
MVGTKGILASPLQMPDNSCFVCTLDGSYAFINTEDGSIAWLKQCASPIFSNPSFMKHFGLILFAEVSGIVHCIDVKGTEVGLFATVVNGKENFYLSISSRFGLIQLAAIYFQDSK